MAFPARQNPPKKYRLQGADTHSRPIPNNTVKEENHFESAFKPSLSLS
jgi:hypothetical protein